MDAAILARYLYAFEANVISLEPRNTLCSWLSVTPNLSLVLRFADHKRWQARWAVAANRLTPPAIWKEMANDRNASVRYLVETRLAAGNDW